MDIQHLRFMKNGDKSYGIAESARSSRLEIVCCEGKLTPSRQKSYLHSREYLT